MRKKVTMKRKVIMKKDAPKRIVLRSQTSKVEEVEKGVIKRKSISKNVDEDRQETEDSKKKDKQKAIGSKKVEQKSVELKKKNKQETSASKKIIKENDLPKKDFIKKEVSNKETIKSSDFFKDLFEKYSIIETSDIYEEFDIFKKSHLEKLSFLNDQMLETYRLAFFYKFYKLKIPKIQYCGKVKVTMFNNALNEIKIEPRSEVESCNLICNLYSILHPLNRNSS